MEARPFCVHAATVRGVEALPVTVEVSATAGIPGFSFTGQGDAAVHEAAWRVRAALKSCGYSIPRLHITVNLAPAEMRKGGSGFDLPIAAAVLAATGQIPTDGLDDALFVGELALDGSVRRVRGAVAYERLARASRLVLVGPQDAGAPLAGEVRCLAHLGQLRQGVSELPRPRASAAACEEALPAAGPDFADVIDQELAKRACLVAAAGGHGMLMVGPPGAGKTMLARRMPSILPPLSGAERDEALLVHSVAGLPTAAIERGGRPFRAPHHSVSVAGLVGGGRPVLPGEVSLAHRGVLFLDELPEFASNALQALRQPIEESEVRLVRADGVYAFPCRFQLVAAANPCPCGHLGDPGRACTCTPARVQAYQAKMGGPLMDRIDVVVQVARPSSERLIRGQCGMGSAEMRDRVAAARERAAARGPARGPGLEGLRFEPRALATLQGMAERLVFGGRAVRRVATVARTVADLEGHDLVHPDDVMEACAFRPSAGVA